MNKVILKSLIDNKPLKKKFIPKTPRITFMNFNDAYVKVINEYESKGYDAARDYAKTSIEEIPADCSGCCACATCHRDRGRG